MGEKMTFEDSKPPTTAKPVQKQNMAKEKLEYKKRKAGERRVKNERAVALAGEVSHTVWADDHQAFDEKVVDKSKSNNECTRCGISRHAWKYC